MTLKDFTDLIVYFNEYTETYVGGEIHEKMSIENIYDAFAHAKKN